MTKKEFYIPVDGKTRVLDESGGEKLLLKDPETVNEVYEWMVDNCFEALGACQNEVARMKKHGESPQLTRMMVVDRFIRCNFGTRDSTPDFMNGRVNFEEVACPLRGICQWEGVICKPKCTKLVRREEECVSAVCLGLENEEAVEKFPRSVSSHIHILGALKKRLNLRSNLEIIKSFKGWHLERRTSILT